MTGFEARCSTTAMGIMPHRNVERALELALTLDIPFWPQLPRVSLYEDMYVQASQNFPGIAIDFDKGRLSFDTARFQQELDAYFVRMDVPETFALTAEYSAVFHKFLSKDLQGYKDIRGQDIGPVSFGFKVLTDENFKPVIYNDEVRTILFDFIQKKANAQYRALKEKNPNAFVWLDEPGLGYVFSGLSGAGWASLTPKRFLSCQILVASEGSATIQYLVYESEGCTVAPKTFDLEPDFNRLTVVYAHDPPQYSGDGGVFGMTTVTCPGVEPYEAGISAFWFAGEGEVSADGLTIEGSDYSGTASWHWHFKRP